MIKLVFGIGLTLFTSVMFANDLSEKQTERIEDESIYSCSTTIWYKNYGTPKVISFYHDDCSSQACCNDYLRSDISFVKLYYAMREKDEAQASVSLPAFNAVEDGLSIEEFAPLEEQP